MTDLPHLITPQEVEVISHDPEKFGPIIERVNTLLARPWTDMERLEGRQTRDWRLLPYVPSIMDHYARVGWRVGWVDRALVFWPTERDRTTRRDFVFSSENP